MCGIVGYIGKKSAEKELVTILKNLEYRGMTRLELQFLMTR